MSVHRDAVTTATRKKATRKKAPRRNGPVIVTRLTPLAESKVKELAAMVPGSVIKIIDTNTAVIWNREYKHPKVRI